MPSAPATASRKIASGLTMPAASASCASWLYSDGVANSTVGANVRIASNTRSLFGCAGNSSDSACTARGSISPAPSPYAVDSRATERMRSAELSPSNPRPKDAVAASRVRWLCGTARSSPGPEPAEYISSAVSVGPLATGGCGCAAVAMARKSWLLASFASTHTRSRRSGVSLRIASTVASCSPSTIASTAPACSTHARTSSGVASSDTGTATAPACTTPRIAAAASSVSRMTIITRSPRCSFKPRSADDTRAT